LAIGVAVGAAVGARPRDVVFLISRQGLAPAFSGLALGLFFAFGLARLLKEMLYTVSPYDPIVFVLSAGALAVVSLLAAGLSAFRACRIDASAILK
jgi:putative ABC transport system permease protein